MLDNDTKTRALEAFRSIDRLYGRGSATRLHEAHCMVVGLGGVGSWTVESLARSGVGKLTLVDLDDVCTTNRNRQLHTLEQTLGKPKVEVMAERAREIHPGLEVTVVQAFLSERNVDALLAQQPDVVIDAIDRAPTKSLIISRAKVYDVQVVTVGGAGGRVDPTQIKVDDLTRSWNDPLLKVVRKQLRQKEGFPRNVRKKWNVPCVYSTEPLRYVNQEGCVQTDKPAGLDGVRLDCFTGFGSVSYVTGAFGLAAAAAAVECILKNVDSE